MIGLTMTFFHVTQDHQKLPHQVKNRRKFILLECKNILNTRKLFENGISKLVKNYEVLSDVRKLKIIPNLHLDCLNVSRYQAHQNLCTFVAKTFQIVEDVLPVTKMHHFYISQ